MSDQIDDDIHTHKRLPLPIHRYVIEQSMLNLGIPSTKAVFSNFGWWSIGVVLIFPVTIPFFPPICPCRKNNRAIPSSWHRRKSPDNFVSKILRIVR